ncbi:hypothetical protein N7509_006491 [Penicillium cosmopolitanum]|uniref:Uncharacterized protein n=1 Tax=Penicillium cosmopolitanum TaxID=1131564 RepID=A0A9W9W0M5_9EURO|nr:uncharacterized protein N7509_006491 [Penicillium cosmopolitanum]KAJ5394704.1 hypothetical protein N7509_006491 [Penicillium cosmopolitanum]
MASSLFQQHLHIQIQDDLKYDIRIEKSNFASGQFYNEDDKCDNLTSDDVDDMIIRHNGGIRMVCSMYGSQGRIDLVDDVKDIRICTSMQPGSSNEFENLTTMQVTRLKLARGTNLGLWEWFLLLSRRDFDHNC